MKLTEAEELLLAPFPDNYRYLAIAAINRGKAFCPSCHFAGHSNCAHFDTCGAFLEPNRRAQSQEGK